MGVQTEDRNKKRLDAFVKNEKAQHDKDRGILTQIVPKDLAKVNFGEVRKRLIEARENNGLSGERFARIDNAINDIVYWFGLNK